MFTVPKSFETLTRTFIRREKATLLGHGFAANAFDFAYLHFEDVSPELEAHTEIAVPDSSQLAGWGPGVLKKGLSEIEAEPLESPARYWKALEGHKGSVFFDDVAGRKLLKVSADLKNDSQPILAWVLINEGRAMATDRYRLADVAVRLEGELEERFALPKQFTYFLDHKLFSHVEVFENGARLVFEDKDGVRAYLVAPMPPAADYPRLGALFPSKYYGGVVGRAGDVVLATRDLVVPDNKPLRFGALGLDDGRALVKCFDGLLEPTAFNPKLIREGLSVVATGTRVNLLQNKPHRPHVFTFEGHDMRYLIMPIRMTNEDAFNKLQSGPVVEGRAPLMGFDSPAPVVDSVDVTPAPVEEITPKKNEEELEMFTVKTVVHPEVKTIAQMVEFVQGHDFEDGAVMVAPGVVLAFNGMDYALYRESRFELFTWSTPKSLGRSSAAPDMLGAYAEALVKTARKLSRGGSKKGQVVCKLEKKHPRFGKPAEDAPAVEPVEAPAPVEVEEVAEVEEPAEDSPAVEEAPAPASTGVRVIETGEGLGAAERAGLIAPALAEAAASGVLPVFVKFSHYTEANRLHIAVGADYLLPVVIDEGGLVSQIEGVTAIQIEGGDFEKAALVLLKRVRAISKAVNRGEAVLAPAGVVAAAAELVTA